MVRQGTTVQLKPEYMDKGDENFVWVAATDEDDGRVLIAPHGTGLAIPPSYVVSTDWLVA